MVLQCMGQRMRCCSARGAGHQLVTLRCLRSAGPSAVPGPPGLHLVMLKGPGSAGNWTGDGMCQACALITSISQSLVLIQCIKCSEIDTKPKLWLRKLWASYIERNSHLVTELASTMTEQILTSVRCGSRWILCSLIMHHMENGSWKLRVWLQILTWQYC